MKQTIRFPFDAHRRLGFSLIEMLIAATIAILIFFVGFVTITGTIRARSESMSRVRATENARLFFQLLEKDLESGFPGPNQMIKGVTNVAAASVTDPATLELREFNNPIDSDQIQFYTRNDISTNPTAPESPDRYVFIRYYVDQAKHTLCREIREDSTGIQKWELNPPNMGLTYDFALFEDIRQLQIDFKYWDEAVKCMKPLAGDPSLQWNGVDFLEGGTPRIPTHILVTVVMFDPYAEARLKNDPMAVTDPNLKYRAFSKTFPIPPGF